MSANTAAASQPPIVQNFVVHYHSTCPACHHWFRCLQIPLRDIVDDCYDVECPKCSKLICRLGRSLTQESLISQFTIQPENLTSHQATGSASESVPSGRGVIEPDERQQQPPTDPPTDHAALSLDQQGPSLSSSQASVTQVEDSASGVSTSQSRSDPIDAANDSPTSSCDFTRPTQTPVSATSKTPEAGSPPRQLRQQLILRLLRNFVSRFDPRRSKRAKRGASPSIEKKLPSTPVPPSPRSHSAISNEASDKTPPAQSNNAAVDTSQAPLTADPNGLQRNRTNSHPSQPPRGANYDTLRQQKTDEAREAQRLKRSCPCGPDCACHPLYGPHTFIRRSNTTPHARMVNNASHRDIRYFNNDLSHRARAVELGFTRPPTPPPPPPQPVAFGVAGTDSSISLGQSSIYSAARLRYPRPRAPRPFDANSRISTSSTLINPSTDNLSSIQPSTRIGPSSLLPAQPATSLVTVPDEYRGAIARGSSEIVSGTGEQFEHHPDEHHRGEGER